jgi:hypothetical protein
MKQLVIVLVLAFLFSSCVSTYQTEKLAATVLNEDQARLIVLRPSIVGVVSTANIYQNNSFVGKMGSGGFLAWNVKPGSITIRSSNGYYKINAVSGKSYFLKLVPKISFSLSDAKYEFELLSQQDGERKMSKLSRPKIKAT